MMALKTGFVFVMLICFTGELMAHENATYYSARRDYRKCMSPMCGGYWVKKVNRDRMRCADGNYQQECYVWNLDLGDLGLSDRQEADINNAPTNYLLKGDLEHINFDGIDASFYELVAEEAWKSATEIVDWTPNNLPDGRFVRLTGNRIYCFTTPCPQPMFAGVLNLRKNFKIDRVDLLETGATKEQIIDAHNVIFDAREGLLAVGYKNRFLDWDARYDRWSFDATHFYFLVRPDECIRTGCSGQICGSEPIITTCEWMPEYACIRMQDCEMQANGCGWTPTAESKACFEDLDY